MTRVALYSISCILLIAYTVMQWLIGYRGSWFTDYQWYLIDQCCQVILFLACTILFPYWFKIAAVFLFCLSSMELIDQIFHKNTKVHLSDYLTVGMSIIISLGFVFILKYRKRKL